MQITPKTEGGNDLSQLKRPVRFQILTCPLVSESESKSYRLLPSRNEIRYSCSTVYRNNIKGKWISEGFS